MNVNEVELKGKKLFVITKYHIYVSSKVIWLSLSKIDLSIPVSMELLHIWEA